MKLKPSLVCQIGKTDESPAAVDSEQIFYFRIERKLVQIFPVEYKLFLYRLT